MIARLRQVRGLLPSHLVVRRLPCYIRAMRQMRTFHHLLALV